MNIAWFFTLSSVCVYFDKNISYCLDREQEQDQHQDPESGKSFISNLFTEIQSCDFDFTIFNLLPLLSVIAEGEESWTTNQGLYLSISIMSIPCLSPVIPHGLAPNTRYAGVWHAQTFDPLRPLKHAAADLVCLWLHYTGWPTAAHHWLLLETLPDQSSSNTWRDIAALVARWDQQPVPPLSGQTDKCHSSKILKLLNGLVDFSLWFLFLSKNVLFTRVINSSRFYWKWLSP